VASRGFPVIALFLYYTQVDYVSYSRFTNWYDLGLRPPGMNMRGDVTRSTWFGWMCNYYVSDYKKLTKQIWGKSFKKLWDT